MSSTGAAITHENGQIIVTDTNLDRFIVSFVTVATIFMLESVYKCFQLISVKRSWTFAIYMTAALTGWLQSVIIFVMYDRPFFKNDWYVAIILLNWTVMIQSFSGVLVNRLILVLHPRSKLRSLVMYVPLFYVPLIITVWIIWFNANAYHSHYWDQINHISETVEVCIMCVCETALSANFIKFSYSMLYSNKSARVKTLVLEADTGTTCDDCQRGNYCRGCG
jgi:hypothetical protein